MWGLHLIMVMKIVKKWIVHQNDKKSQQKPKFSIIRICRFSADHIPHLSRIVETTVHRLFIRRKYTLGYLGYLLSLLRNGFTYWAAEVGEWRDTRGLASLRPPNVFWENPVYPRVLPFEEMEIGMLLCARTSHQIFLWRWAPHKTFQV